MTALCVAFIVVAFMCGGVLGMMVLAIVSAYRMKRMWERIHHLQRLVDRYYSVIEEHDLERWVREAE
jgi:hypothetical protein